MNISKKIETLLKNIEEVNNIYVDNDLDDERTDSIWYGGTLITFDYKSYEIVYKTEGDVSLSFTNPDTNEEFDMKDKNNAGDVGYELCCIGIDTDAKLKTLEEQATDLCWGSKNYYKMLIWDGDELIAEKQDSGFMYSFSSEEQIKETIELIEKFGGTKL